MNGRLGPLSLAWSLLVLIAGGTAWAQVSTGGRAAVKIDSTTVYWAVAPDSAGAQREAVRLEVLLQTVRDELTDPESLILVERDSTAVMYLDTLAVLVVRPENRVHTDQSSRANALALRRELLRSLLTVRSHGEEGLLLRLFLGVVFPFLLLVILRLTRFWLRRWERQWRVPLRQWLVQTAERRRLHRNEAIIRRIVSTLTGIERLGAYTGIVLVVSFVWFALFPETRPLAATLLDRILGPALDLLGDTARGALLLAYSLGVFLVAFWVNRRLGRRRREHRPDELLADAAVHIPLRLGIWIAAVFLVLFPYPGAPRLLAVGVLLLILLGVLVAMRPVVEEIACGVYFNLLHTLKLGDRLHLEGQAYEVRDLGFAHVKLDRDGRTVWLPYTRILKSEISVEPPPERLT